MSLPSQPLAKSAVLADLERVVAAFAAEVVEARAAAQQVVAINAGASTVVTEHRVAAAAAVQRVVAGPAV